MNGAIAITSDISIWELKEIKEIDDHKNRKKLGLSIEDTSSFFEVEHITY